MKKFLTLILLSLCIVTMASCNSNGKAVLNSNVNNKSVVKVVVSFNPLKEFAEAVGKDKISVETIVPKGAEPHDFEPKIKDYENISDSDVFIYNGLGIDSWVDKALEVMNKKDLILVEASKGCNLIKASDEGEENEEFKYDPHVWLSVKQASIETYNIKQALIKADPGNKAFYEKNYLAFKVSLDSIYNKYTKKFAAVKNKSFVTGHAAFAYFCRDYGLKQNSVEDIYAEGEPSPKKLEELINYCTLNKVKIIFAEQMASPKVSQTLASEINGKVEKIYTIESQEDNKDYIECMKDNLEKVYKSLLQ